LLKETSLTVWTSSLIRTASEHGSLDCASRNLNIHSKNQLVPGDSDSVIKTQLPVYGRVAAGSEFCPVLSFVNSGRLLQALVNGRSNYDSFKVAKCLVV